jgi:hypothetical protein
MSVYYIGNYSSEVDCDSIVHQIKNQEGHYKTSAKPYGDNMQLSPELTNEAMTMYAAWEEAGYTKTDIIEWINYYPKKHFDDTVLNSLYKILKINPKNVWISSIRPGKCVPWHWDIEDHADEWSKEGELVRYTLYLDDSKLGHTFVVGDRALYMIPKGDMYEWDKWNDYHLGFNCGFEQKYILHIVGVKCR